MTNLYLSLVSLIPRQLRSRSFWRLLSTMLPKGQVARMRMDYESGKFDESTLVAKEPISQFDSWFKEASTENAVGAKAMTLATCSAAGRPSARIVLLMGYDNKGFCFGTSYDSPTGTELSENPFASLVFYWHKFYRQVTVVGQVEKLSAEQSEKHFHSMPRQSQIGICSSEQSSIISSRKILERKIEELNEAYADENIEIPKPANWGSFLVVPEKVEFWQGQSSRVHDRIVFRKLKPEETIDPNLTKVGEDGWVFERLSP